MIDTSNANGHALAVELVADPRRKLELFIRTVVGSKSLAVSDGMMGAVLMSLMPMVTTMLGRASPETVGEYCTLLSSAFALVADTKVSEDAFLQHLAAWRPNE
jgi:hypothetical protein